MYSILYSCFFILNRVRKKYEKNPQKCIAKFCTKIIGYIEAYYNLYVVKRYKKDIRKKRGITDVKRKNKLIISLTSYPARINTVWITIETLLRQSVKADEIILWLAKSQFDGEKDLPKELLELKKRGLTIRWCDDLKSHKKYFYVMQEYPQDYIILADDDMFYPYDTVKKLWNLHKKYPNDICSITTQKIEPNFYTEPSKWKNPKSIEKIHSSRKVQIFTGSGSLYPPNSIDKDAFDKELMLEVCPFADDLWLTFMALKKGVCISSLDKWRAFPITIYGTPENSLWYINAQDGKNDEQWKKLSEIYPDFFRQMENDNE